MLLAPLFWTRRLQKVYWKNCNYIGNSPNLANLEEKNGCRYFVGTYSNREFNGQSDDYVYLVLSVKTNSSQNVLDMEKFLSSVLGWELIVNFNVLYLKLSDFLSAFLRQKSSYHWN